MDGEENRGGDGKVVKCADIVRIFFGSPGEALVCPGLNSKAVSDMMQISAVELLCVYISAR